MRCATCGAQVGFGSICISVYSDRYDTVNLCQTCRHTLLGPEIDERVRRLVRLKGWTQPPLPTM